MIFVNFYGSFKKLNEVDEIIVNPKINDGLFDDENNIVKLIKKDDLNSAVESAKLYINKGIEFAKDNPPDYQINKNTIIYN